MKKSEFLKVLKSHKAYIIRNRRNWLFFYLPESEYKIIMDILSDTKWSIHSNYVKKEASFSISLTL